MKRFNFAKIKELREAAGITQLQLARRVGVAVQQVSTWENSGGDKSLTTKYLAKIAHILKSKTDDFFV